jgi:hypothetical protein
LLSPSLACDSVALPLPTNTKQKKNVVDRENEETKQKKIYERKYKQFEIVVCFFFDLGKNAG